MCPPCLAPLFGDDEGLYVVIEAQALFNPSDCSENLEWPCTVVASSPLTVLTCTADTTMAPTRSESETVYSGCNHNKK